MKNVFIILTGMVLAAGMAFGYTMPGAFPYDALVTYDHGGMPVTAGALHIAASPTYWMASKAYDKDGEAEDLGYSYVDPISGDTIVVTEDDTLIALPIDLGYGITDRILVDLTVQLLMPKATPSEGDAVDASGLGDVWVKGRYIAPLGGNAYLGPRLGIKIPVGKVDLDDENLELGDNQMDIDIAAVGAILPTEAGFAGNGQIGLRYRMKGSYEYEMVNPVNPEEMITVKYDETPGMLIYTLLEPGYSMGIEKAFQIYVPILYETSMAVKSQAIEPEEGDEETVEDSETSGLAVGLAPKYTLDANNTIGLKFLYPLMGKNVPQAMNIGLTYEGYIPF
jgi:hypothetical protein